MPDDSSKLPHLIITSTRQGGTSVYAGISVDEHGNLVMDGQDVGAAPLEDFGDSDYEWWLTIPAASKDQLLLHLIQHVFSQSASPSSALMEFMKERGIRYDFSSYM